ncbi:predicted protein [Coccidioides posadasii str. Silveira]|uniref:Predicted protein n=2 Tax=Coccidioides posadasii TaxID=199306 RepID=E9DG27_COCPS|nr:predicted protein [Coccidioides posadasii str. Silveira]KMM68292.1 hypothetical protein CPAG_04622 [Coccidioides posadasii RMSCC 3488]
MFLGSQNDWAPQASKLGTAMSVSKTKLGECGRQHYGAGRGECVEILLYANTGEAFKNSFAKTQPIGHMCLPNCPNLASPGGMRLHKQSSAPIVKLLNNSQDKRCTPTPYRVQSKLSEEFHPVLYGQLRTKFGYRVLRTEAYNGTYYVRHIECIKD